MTQGQSWEELGGGEYIQNSQRANLNIKKEKNIKINGVKFFLLRTFNRTIRRRLTIIIMVLIL